jgi:hypothetical protein
LSFQSKWSLEDSEGGVEDPIPIKAGDLDVKIIDVEEYSTQREIDAMFERRRGPDEINDTMRLSQRSGNADEIQPLVQVFFGRLK